MTHQAQPGEWWFGTPCESCSERLLIANDTSRGTVRVDLAGPGELAIRCGSCGHVNKVKPEVITSQPIDAG